MKKKFVPPIKMSLIILAHNEEKYIGDCLEYAVKNSEFTEIVVVDNISTDKTHAIVEKMAQRYPSAGIRVVFEPQKGMVRARQRGFLEARQDSEVLAYVDADTHMPKGWAKTVQREFADNPKLALLSGPGIYYDIPAFQRMLVWAYWIGAMPMYFALGYMAQGANMAFRRSVLEKMGGFDVRIEFYGEDTNVARRAKDHGKVKFKFTHVMHFSGRRLKGQGFFNTARKYVSNFFSEAAAGKQIDKEYKDFR
jgi:cellulose synthase/poly-beta-1,6-N-acetylglucosamine synthase-like glycosyltransferase